MTSLRVALTRVFHRVGFAWLIFALLIASALAVTAAYGQRSRPGPIPIAGPAHTVMGQAVADDVTTQAWTLTISVNDPADLPDFVRVWRVRNGGWCPVVSLPTFDHWLPHAVVPIPTTRFAAGDLVMLEHIPGVALDLQMFGWFRGERVGGFTVTTSGPGGGRPFVHVDCSP